ncbi:MAG: AraC family transcriptional regulator [Puniceicoccaceae bacterium]|nr:MAG: AraC family transcriptional regulator [Puniceicoccaceae bacterium]
MELEARTQPRVCGDPHTEAKLLCGSAEGAHQLHRIRLGRQGWRAAPPFGKPGHGAHVLIFDADGPLAIRVRGENIGLGPGSLLWLCGRPPPDLSITATRPPVELLCWRFAEEGLPPGLQDLLPSTTAPRSFRSPTAPLGIRNLATGLRNCPVAPVLRDLWGSAKLAELVTLLLPSWPEPASPGAPPGGRHPALLRAVSFMRRHLGEPIGLDAIAAAAGASASHLSRLFSSEFGRGPTHYLRELRMRRAAELLRTGRSNVTETAYSVGYSSLAQFSRAFLAFHGISPGRFLKDGMDRSRKPQNMIKNG